MLIKKVGDKLMEFGIDYKHNSIVYDLKNPDKVIGDFIEYVSRHLPETEGEFRLICCIVNQSAVELHGRRLYTNACFAIIIIEGSMNSRVKEFLFDNTKKRVLMNGDNGSNKYFHRFDFLKIHFLTSNLRQYVNLLQS